MTARIPSHTLVIVKSFIDVSDFMRPCERWRAPRGASRAAPSARYSGHAPDYLRDAWPPAAVPRPSPRTHSRTSRTAATACWARSAAESGAHAFRTRLGHIVSVPRSTRGARASEAYLRVVLRPGGVGTRYR